MIVPIETGQAPRAIGPYSQGIQSAPWVFVSGQLPLDPASGGLVSSDIRQQTRQVLQNIAQILAASGLSLRAVVKTTIYLVDLAAFDAVNAVYAEFFTAPCPARSTVQVSALPKGAQVEIDAIAVQP